MRGLRLLVERVQDSANCGARNGDCDTSAVSGLVARNRQAGTARIGLRLGRRCVVTGADDGVLSWSSGLAQGAWTRYLLHLHDGAADLVAAQPTAIATPAAP